MDPEMLKQILAGACDHYGNQMAGDFKPSVEQPPAGMAQNMGGDDLSKEATMSPAHADPESNEMSPEIIKMLLDAGADTDVNSPPPSDGLEEMSLPELLKQKVPGR